MFVLGTNSAYKDNKFEFINLIIILIIIIIITIITIIRLIAKKDYLKGVSCVFPSSSSSSSVVVVVVGCCCRRRVAVVASVVAVGVVEMSSLSQALQAT